MSDVVLHQSFDTRILTLTSGSPVVSAFGGGDSVIVGLANGFEVEFTGSGLSLDGVTPVSGVVTAITAYFVLDGISTLAAVMTPSSGLTFEFSPQGLARALNRQPNTIVGSSDFDRIVGGNDTDIVYPKVGSDEVSLGAGNDVVALGASADGAPPDGLIYNGGRGTDVLGATSLLTATLDLRAVTLISVEHIELSSADAIFNSSQLSSATGLANITEISGNFLSEVRVLQNTAVADLGGVPGVGDQEWRLIGQNQDDVQRGSDILNLVMQGRGGHDVIRGRGADEGLEGGAGDDTLIGGDGLDDLFGGLGADHLTGSTGNDQKTGGDGRDTFIFERGCAADTITDFQAFGPERDRIDLSEVTSVTGFADLRANHMLIQGADVLLQLGNGDSILLRAVVRVDLDATDFIFAA